MDVVDRVQDATIVVLQGQTVMFTTLTRDGTQFVESHLS